MQRERERERERESRLVESLTSSIYISKQVFWTGGVIGNQWNSEVFFRFGLNMCHAR